MNDLLSSLICIDRDIAYDMAEKKLSHINIKEKQFWEENLELFVSIENKKWKWLKRLSKEEVEEEMENPYSKYWTSKCYYAEERKLCTNIIESLRVCKNDEIYLSLKDFNILK